MDLGHPLTSLVPTLAGPVLEVLANTTKPLSGREVMRLLPRRASQQGVQNAIDDLAHHGLVTQTAAGNSILNTLNRDHILAPFIIQIAGLRNDLLAAIATIVEEEAAGAHRVVLFGSVARGDAHEDSDIDLLLIWDNGTPEVSPAPNIQSRIQRLTGNPCNVLHYTSSEYAALPETAPELHATISSDAIDLLETIDR